MKPFYSGGDRGKLFSFIAASCNMVGLTERLKEAKGDFSRLPDMPNAPVVLVSFLERTDENKMDPANAQYNWYTGMCLAGADCTNADFVPRNDSIWYDAITPQLTANQNAAVKTLYATATPEFWIAAAHANGIYDKDMEFANYAAEMRADLAKKLRHRACRRKSSSTKLKLVSAATSPLSCFCVRVSPAARINSTISAKTECWTWVASACWSLAWQLLRELLSRS